MMITHIVSEYETLDKINYYHIIYVGRTLRTTIEFFVESA